MASSPTDDDVSISVLTDPATHLNGTLNLSGTLDGTPDGRYSTPEFHMYTGAYEGDASHYALSLSHNALERRNRELEAQVHKLQKETRQRVARAKKAEDTQRSTEGESVSPKMYRSRSVVQDAPSESKAMEDFIKHLQAELETAEKDKRGLTSQLEEYKHRCLNCEKRRREISTELDEALVIASNRSQELEECRRELNSSTTVVTLQQKIRERDSKIYQIQSENASLQQLYEESVADNKTLSGALREAETRSQDLQNQLTDKKRTISRHDQTLAELQLEKRSLEELRDFHKKRTETAAAAVHDHGSEEENDVILEDTRQVILELQTRILQMHNVIRQQTGMIDDLRRKIQRRSQDSLTGIGLQAPSNNTNPFLPSPTVNTGVNTASGRSPGQPRRSNESRRSPGESRRSPQADLSLDEPTTMVGQPEDDETSLMRVTLPEARPSIDSPRNPASVRPRVPSSALTGVVINGERPTQRPAPAFNFQTQAVVGGLPSSNAGMVGARVVMPEPRMPARVGPHTEPIVRHPPPISDRRTATEPIHMTTESNLYTTGLRQPVEQSDHVEDGPRDCPICNKRFPLLSQEAFELHVNHCLMKAETSPTLTPQQPPVTPLTPPPDTAQGEMLECPVCSQIYAPGTSQDEFTHHVQSHFAEENFEVLRQ